MNRGARPAGPPYRSRPTNRPPRRNGPPPPGRRKPAGRPKTSKSSVAKKNAKRIPSIIGVIASVIPLVDWIMEKISPKQYDFKVNEKVIFREDYADLDIEGSAIPVYRVCKLGDSANTFNLWDPSEKRVVAENIDGHCLEKAPKH